MNGIFKYIIFVSVSAVAAFIFTRVCKDIQFNEAYTLTIALVALLRTCKEEKEND